MFTYDYSATNDRKLIEPGQYILQVVGVKEKTSQKGYPMVMVVLEVTNINKKFVGQKIFHNIVFMPPGTSGAGISKHWLHCLGEPYEGVVEVKPESWLGKLVKANVGRRSYIDKDGNTQEVNNITQVILDEAEEEEEI